MAIKKRYNNRRGFTLMELLVVIAVIMTLIGILVPGLQGVKRIAKNLEQKSLFHNIDIGLETFRNGFGDFPESKRKEDGGLHYTGAQHLAEVLVGRDARGFEPSQLGKWKWPGDSDLYTDTPKSIARRKPLYVNLKDTGAFTPIELYGSGNTGDVYPEGPSGERAPFIADMFYRKKITLLTTGETVKVGSPILYYKANRSSKDFFKLSNTARTDFDKWKYNYKDNEDVIDLGTIMEPVSVDNPIQMDAAKFYKSISDRNAPFDRPLNENSYILISAGFDGIYGTKDDVTNIKIK
jgi:prepilin-type N-terminal cleavage/methylation domain-containing protein